MANILQIKHNAASDVAPNSLYGGELAFNEVGNKLYIGKDSNQLGAIAGDGKLLTLDTFQTVVSAVTFNDVVALSSASTVTQPTTANNNSVATTQYVQNVFSLLDGGNFDENVVAAGTGKYWYTPTTANNLNKWYNIASWYTDVNHTQPAAYLPDANTDVVILGTVRPFADIDRNDWVQPNSINSGETGVTFYSLQYGNITISISGNATFSGNATYNV